MSDSVFLVVDKAVGLAQVTSEIIGAIGMTSKYFSSGQDALNYVKANIVNGTQLVVLSNVDLEDMDCFELVAKIKKIRPTAKIIIMSGYPRNQEKARRLGADFLAKESKFFTNLKVLVPRLATQ
jgi:CheY-like chemotaxis protein